ncbi:putative RPAP1 family protein [Skeletonema marinoi]|uniref:RPAP1 family protein n=2 Tax=Skeletonema marinoi TaxID=267567 RepID=A0AAD8YFW2_9STRA|nr:putative RPAP1 family protein [Skeletonema marinoi]
MQGHPSFPMMWAARAAAEQAERAAIHRLNKMIQNDDENDEHTELNAMRFDELLRRFFVDNLLPVILWFVELIIFITILAILSVASYVALYNLVIMRGLEVQSRPIFFDYNPGTQGQSHPLPPIGRVDLRSSKRAPWAYSCSSADDSLCVIDDDRIKGPKELKLCRELNNETSNTECQKEEVDHSSPPILLPDQRYFFEVTLKLPESEINKQRRWNAQPYADFFSDDGSAHNNSKTGHDRWTGEDIEILEEECSDADNWVPLNGTEQTGLDNHTKVKKESTDQIVSDEEESVSSVEHNVEQRSEKVEDTGKSSFPFGKIASNKAVKGRPNVFLDQKPSREDEEKSLADMVMKGHSKYEIFTAAIYSYITMANTEGLTDEVVSSMLAMPSPDEERQLHSRKHAADNHPRFPQRALARREEMMESLGEGEMPAARVIRASRAPKIHSSAALKNKTQNIDIKEQSITPTPPAEIMERTQQKGDSDRPTDSVANKNSHRPVIISDSIRERPAEPNNNKSTSATAQPKKRESRFKQRQLKKGGSTNPTVGGFPSLDFAPVGSLTLRRKEGAKGKEKVAELLSKIRTPEDMDLAYNEAIELGLAPSLPTSSLERFTLNPLLMKLFVHPYHVVNVNPSSIGLYDPFELYATSFMSDISHVPSGAELYPPTTITPIEKSGTNGSCYRADSSAASAESDAKVFYNDPPWILLSRMRILPCLSDVIAFLSKDVSSGGRIQVATLQSICGILAMLAVRLPGAALAIANHKGLLPFLASYCLSPRPDESGALFDTQNVLPFLILLCTLARQSKDVAGLDMPFDSIMPHLQGILCLQTDNENELEVQIWSLVLLRILVRYGLAIEHVQSLISIAAPHVAVQKPQNTICVHFLSFFADICDASNVIQSQSGSQLSSIPEQDNSLPMSAVWLSSSVKSCTTSLPALLRDCSSDDRDSVLKMASSQLRFLSSFATAAKQSTTTASVPILSKESCRSVIEGILESDLLKHALETSLGWSYRASWLEVDDESRAIALENEAIACAFVISFMDLAANFATVNVIAPKLLVAVLSVLNNVKSQNGELAHTNGNNVHVARQSWFVEAEYSVLKYLSDIGAGENGRSLILAFAVTLVGRMNVGHEALAYFVFGQQDLFRVNGCTDLFRSLFLGELSVASRDRKEQLEHSAKLFNKGPLNSLRCTADFSTAANARQERFFLPVGTTWIWNVLSSTITSGEAYGEDQGIKNATGIVAGALSLLMQLEVSCPLQVNTGTKLYHLCNVCLFPEEILRDDTIAASLSLLFSQLCGVPSKESNDFVVVRDFIQECFQHSRLSRAKKATDDEATDTDPSLATEKLLLDDEMRALDDFVGDLCESFIEYGGQYVFCARFMRFFFRHDFPTKITKSVAEKLLPILNLLSVEDETRDSLQLSLLQSMKGGLPSMDSSSRDSSALLDIFAAALKKVNKLNRQDYFYMLSISFLSRNMESFQRCVWS